MTWATARPRPSSPCSSARPAPHPNNSAASSACRREAVAPSACSRSEEHTSELQSHSDLVCRLLLEKKKESDKKVIQLSSVGVLTFTLPLTYVNRVWCGGFRR